MADGSLYIVAKTNPMGSERVLCHAQPGQTIAEMLGEGAAHSCEVTLGGYPVPKDLWGRVRPKAGQTLHVVVYPQGGNGGKWARAILTVVVLYFAWWAAPYLAGYGASAAAVGAWAAGISIVGMMAINALIPPPTAKGLNGGGGDPFQQLNSLTGTSNQANPYGVIPCVVGTKRFFPPHAALPYTEISGDDQYLRMLLDLGLETEPGSIDISDIQIGETPITSFEDVDYEISTAPSLFSQDIYELAVGVALNTSSDTAIRTTQAASREISLDLIFNGGLFGVDDKNNTVTGTVRFFIEYRAVGDTTWIPVGNAGGVTTTGGLQRVSATGSPNWYMVSSTKRKTLRCGMRWKVPSGQYEVKVMRDSSTFTGAVSGGTVGDCVWSVLRSVNPQNPSTTGTLKLAVRIKATDQLNGVVQNLSVLASQKIRGIDPVTYMDTAAAATENPAWIYLWLMTQCPAVMRRVGDARMDLAGICDWAAECDAKGYKIGFVMDSPRAFGDVLRDVMAAGRASFGLRNGLYSAVRDIEQTVPVQMFTPANSWGFSYSRSFAEPPHALRVKFTNPEANDQQDVRLVYWDGYSAANATRFEELDLSMVIDPAAAWRLGRYHLAVMWLRPTQYSFQADIEHMVCERGDLVQVSHDIIGWGLAWGRIKSVSGTRVLLDGPFTPEAGKTYRLRVRRATNDQGEYSATPTVTWDSVSITFDNTTDIDSLNGPTTVLTSDGSTVIQSGDLYVIGEVNKVTTPLIVRAIEPGDDFTATLTCVDANAGIWSADSGTPPAFVSDITGKPWCAPPLPPVVSIWAGDSAPDDAGVIHAETSFGGEPQTGIHRLPSYKQRQITGKDDF